MTNDDDDALFNNPLVDRFRRARARVNGRLDAGTKEMERRKRRHFVLLHLRDSISVFKNKTRSNKTTDRRLVEGAVEHADFHKARQRAGELLVDILKLTTALRFVRVELHEPNVAKLVALDL